MSDYRQRRKVFQDISGSSVLAAADNLSSTARTLVAGRAGYSIYIQRLFIDVVTDNAATQTFQDTASSPLIIASPKASPGLGGIEFDYGSEGRKLGEGKDFVWKNSGAGLAADVHWEGYIRPTATSRTLTQV